MTRYTSNDKGKQQMLTADTIDMIVNSECYWQGSYTGLIMEQIRNSQEEHINPASYQVKLYSIIEITQQRSKYYT